MDFEKISDEFIKSLEVRHYSKFDFYDKLMDFLESKQIFCSEEEENLLESMSYQKARQLGYAGFKVILEIDDLAKFTDKMNKFIKKHDFYLFHIIHEPEDENDLSLSDIWEKWNSLPPRGWVAGWCSCGEFFPYTFDIASMDLEAEKLVDINCQKPIRLKSENIEKAIFCSDNYLRLIMKNGKRFIVKIFVSVKNVALDFTDDRMAMFKKMVES